MTKYDAFIQFEKENPSNDILSFREMKDEFEIAWESGQFNEDPKGECAS